MRFLGDLGYSAEDREPVRCGDHDRASGMSSRIVQRRWAGCLVNTVPDMIINRRQFWRSTVFRRCPFCFSGRPQVPFRRRHDDRPP